MLPARRNPSGAARGGRRLPAGAGFLLATLLLGGCAGMPAGDEDRADPGAATRDGPAPESSLSREVLYKLLVAEFAGRRGDTALAYDNYLEVARETGDPRVAERAVRIAMFARATTGGGSRRWSSGPTSRRGTWRPCRPTRPC